MTSPVAIRRSEDRGELVDSLSDDEQFTLLHLMAADPDLAGGFCRHYSQVVAARPMLAATRR